MSNIKRNHAAKALDRMSKNPSHELAMTPEERLKNQYKIIRKDLLKLREDLTHGYEMARSYITRVEPRTFVKDLLKTK